MGDTPRHWLGRCLGRQALRQHIEHTRVCYVHLLESPLLPTPPRRCGCRTPSLRRHPWRCWPLRRRRRKRRAARRLGELCLVSSPLEAGLTVCLKLCSVRPSAASSHWLSRHAALSLGPLLPAGGSGRRRRPRRRAARQGQLSARRGRGACTSARCGRCGKTSQVRGAGCLGGGVRLHTWEGCGVRCAGGPEFVKLDQSLCFTHDTLALHAAQTPRRRRSCCWRHGGSLRPAAHPGAC